MGICGILELNIQAGSTQHNLNFILLRVRREGVFLCFSPGFFSYHVYRPHGVPRL